MWVAFCAFVFLMCLSSNGTQAAVFNVTSFQVNSVSPTLEVENGTRVTFECEGNGHSDYQLTIMGQRSNVIIPVSLNIGDNSSIVVGNKTMYCNSTDVYVCTPHMGMTTGLSRNVSVNVRCAPELNTTVDKIHVSVVKGKRLEMKFAINSYPPPTSFNLFKTANETAIPDRVKRDVREVPTNRYNAVYVPLDRPQGVIILQMHGLDTKDSGQYSLSVQNGIGGALEINFNVNVKKDDGDDDDDKIHAIIGSVCGVIGALAVIVGCVCGLWRYRLNK